MLAEERRRDYGPSGACTLSQGGCRRVGSIYRTVSPSQLPSATSLHSGRAEVSLDGGFSIPRRQVQDFGANLGWVYIWRCVTKIYTTGQEMLHFWQLSCAAEFDMHDDQCVSGLVSVYPDCRTQGIKCAALTYAPMYIIGWNKVGSFRNLVRL